MGRGIILITQESEVVLMATWKRGLCGVVLGLCVGAGALTSFGRPDSKEDRANARARVEAARMVYQSILALHQENPNVEPFDAEKRYRWSRRWMEAQRDVSAKKENQVAAIKGHLLRMKTLEKVVKSMTKETMALYEAKAVEFYRLEAEKWLRQATGN
jgi:hypothetical protein